MLVPIKNPKSIQPTGLVKISSKNNENENTRNATRDIFESKLFVEFINNNEPHRKIINKRIMVGMAPNFKRNLTKSESDVKSVNRILK